MRHSCGTFCNDNQVMRLQSVSDVDQCIVTSFYLSCRCDSLQTQVPVQEILGNRPVANAV